MKVLLISHTPTTTYESMGKTLFSLFSALQPDELCQFYLYPSLPDVAHCGAYYRITDKDVLKGYATLRVRGGEVYPVVGGSAPFENPEDEALYRNPKNKKPLRMLLRDGMWRFAHWYTKGLRAFIEREKPTAIFVAPGTASCIYHAALRVSRDYRLPIVSYICDDYCFVKRPASLLGRWHLKNLKKITERLQKACVRSVVISTALKKRYEDAFSTPCEVVMTGTSLPIASAPKVVTPPSSITYMGNLCFNRYRSLLEVGQALDRLNETHGTSYTLDIYSGDTDRNMIDPLSGARSIRFHGFVTGEAYTKIFNNASLFLHVEAFDEDSMDQVKDSVSTKIADCLASGTPLLAYGPQNVASMQHLRDNACALYAATPTELDDVLYRAFFDGDARRAAAENGILTARQYHDRAENSRKIRRIMGEVCHENSAN